MSNAESWMFVVGLVVIIILLQTVLEGVKLILKRLDRMDGK